MKTGYILLSKCLILFFSLLTYQVISQKIDDNLEYFTYKTITGVDYDLAHTNPAVSIIEIENPYKNDLMNPAEYEYYIVPTAIYLNDHFSDRVSFCWSYDIDYKLYKDSDPMPYGESTLKVRTGETLTLTKVYEHPDFYSIPNNTWESFRLELSNPVKTRLCNTDPQPPFPTDIRIELRIVVKRRELLEKSTLVSFDGNGYNLNAHNLQMNWSLLPNASYYEVEYEFVDINEIVNPNDLFSRAVRVETNNNFYNLDLVYPEGKFYWRVRPVNFEIGDYKEQIVVGTWSEAKSLDWSGFESDFNWNSSISFAEEGKNKRTVSFFDQSLRKRQNLVDLKTENNVLVDEIDYDAEGKEALKFIPVPGSTFIDFTFKNAFNVFQTDPNSLPQAYCYLNFDKPVADNAAILSGSSFYYSYNNSINVKSNLQKYIPNAQLKPFIHTKYKRDDRGLIEAQGGVGPLHQLGSGHETKNYYLTATKAELQRLFGKKEIGEAAHYKKNIVLDPNMQASVSYLDMTDKVVATALIGEPPANVKPLEDIGSQAINSALVNGMKSDNNIESVNVLFNETPTFKDFEFHYQVDGLKFDLLPNSKCKECRYKATFYAEDNCGLKLEINSIVAGGYNYSYTDQTLTVNIVPSSQPSDECNPSTYSTSEISFVVRADEFGDFKIYKSLDINPYTSAELMSFAIEQVESYTVIKDRIAMEYDLCDCELDCHTKCIALVKKDHPTWDPVIDKVLFDAAVAECEDVECTSSDEISEGEGSPCELMLAKMEYQLDPDNEQNSSSFNLLDFVIHGPQEPLNSVKIYFIDSDGTGYYILNNEVYNISEDIPVLMSTPFNVKLLGKDGLEETFTLPSGLRTMMKSSNCWQSNWAHDMVPAHREYCYYTKCQELGIASVMNFPSSHSFNIQLSSTTSFDQAKLKYLCSNVACSNEENFLLNLVSDQDPFFKNSSFINCKTEMNAYILDYINKKNFDDKAALSSNIGSSHLVPYVKYVVNQILANNVTAPGLTRAQMEWQMIINIYLALKEELFYDCYQCNTDNDMYRVLIKDPLLYKITGLQSAKEWLDLKITESHDCSKRASYWIEDLKKDFNNYTIPPQDEALFNSYLETHCDQACPVAKGECQEPTELLDTLPYHCGCDGIGHFRIKEAPFYLNGTNKFVHFALNAQLLTPPIPNSPFQHPFHNNIPQDVSREFLIMVPGITGPFRQNIRVQAIQDLCGHVPIKDLKIAVYISFPCGSNCALNASQLIPIYSQTNIFGATILEYPAFVGGLPFDFIIQFYIDKKDDIGNTNGSFFSYEILSPFNNKATKLQIPPTTAYNPFPLTKGNWSSFTGLQEINTYLSTHGMSNDDAEKYVSKIWNCTPSCRVIEPCFQDLFEVLKVYSANQPPPTPTICTTRVLPSFQCDPSYQLSHTVCTFVNNFESYITLGQPFFEPYIIYLLDQNGGFVNLAYSKIVSYTATELSVNQLDFFSILNPLNGYKTVPMYVKFLLKTPVPLETPGHPVVYVFHEAYGVIQTKNSKMLPITNTQYCKKLVNVDNYRNNCIDQINAAIESKAFDEYIKQIDNKISEFKANEKKCIRDQSEDYWVNYNLKEYQYTLYYYDQAGNLIKTVPPEAVVPLRGINFTKGCQNNDSIPVHKEKYFSTYVYNSYNQPLSQETADAGKTTFYYDKINRLKLSQDSRQTPLDYFSYVKHDNLNRPIEVGELQDYTFNAEDLNNPNFPDPNTSSFTTAFVNQTLYTDEYSGNGFGAPRKQSNLRGRVSAQCYEDNCFVYDYDVHGNVKTFYQYQPELGWKDLKYEFDLINGNVKQLQYQPDVVAERFNHRYLYDKDNRLTHAYTSRNNYLWDEDARYFYYLHGPMARVEYGDDKVQGVDYTYTLQGWIKGNNSMGTGLHTKDPNNDGYLTNGTINPNRYMAQDAYGYQLGYFQNDYAPIANNPMENILADEITHSWVDMGTSILGPALSKGLYNGNIAWMMTDLFFEDYADPPGTRINGMAYQYDQLNRITQAKSYKSTQGSVHLSIHNVNGGNSYNENYTYDRNGNIKTVKRHHVEYGLIDNLTYNPSISVGDQPNLLRLVDDDPGSDKITNITDQVYEYNSLGNLIKDGPESTIIWDVNNKIIKHTEELNQASNIDSRISDYRYDPHGNKASSIITLSDVNQNRNVTNVYYVRDPQGKELAVYRSLLDELDGENSFALRLEELDLYGSEQLGTRYIDDLVRAANLPEVSRTRQRVQYFFRNHLSNVLVRVSDRRIAYPFLGNFDHYESEEVSSHDYYPFGTELRRTENIYGFHTDQRFAFNGKEISHKTGGQTNYDYGFRIYNAGLGRFLSVDPLTKSYPELTPYQFASNSPIANIDLDGLEAFPSTSMLIKEAGITTATDQQLKYKVSELAYNINAIKESPGGKFANGMINTTFGVVGTIASVTYIAGSGSSGAPLGGASALMLSLGEIGVGFGQMADALKGGNSYVHNVNTMPGLIAAGSNSPYAELIDGISSLGPSALTSEGLFSFIEDGLGFASTFKDFTKSPSILNTLSAIDQGLDINDFRLGLLQLKNSFDSNNNLQNQTLQYTLGYTVRKGDTLSSIAKRLNTTVDILSQQNNINNPDDIKTGQNLNYSNSVQSH